MSEKNYLLELFSKRLKDVRTELKFNYSEMATHCGLLYAAYSRLERGDGGSVENVFKVCNYLASLDYNINYFIKEDNSSENIKNEEMFFLSFDRNKA
ncbi:helix-turn-helix domain-containing protein, partial [Tenacibaculum ovolyticum]|uniref:helix-turn-helix domain-containing protein n=1 Tax=Tenacibaculum ovolyticum TaxID=104270 RepID=UPI000B3312AB